MQPSNHPSNHNMASLTPVEQAQYTIDSALEGPNERWKALQEGIARAPAEITSETIAEGFTTLIAQLQALISRIDLVHSDSKQPWLDAGRTVDGITNRLKSVVADAKRDLNDRLTAYQVAKQAKIDADRAAIRVKEAEDPEPGWSPRQDTSRRAARVVSVEGASSHLSVEKVVEIVDVKKVPIRYLRRPKVLAAIVAELRADAQKGDEIAGIKVTEQAQSRVKR